MAERRGLDSLLAPRRIFLLIAVVLTITLVVAPWPTEQDSTALSSYDATPAGARGFYEILDRLGQPVERRLEAMRDTLDPDALYVVLEPAIPMTVSEVHRLLEAVRDGARLLALPAAESRLADSLEVRRVAVVHENGVAANGRVVPRTGPAQAFGVGWVRWVLRGAGTEDEDSAPTYVPPSAAVTLLSLDTRRGPEPMVVGLPYGRGRVVIAAEPDLFRNSTVREDDGSVRIVRFVEWLTDGHRVPIVFDEYHHGYGTHAGVLREARRALIDSAAGRVVLQIAGAGLLLLLALAVRPIRPQPRVSIERRSPLEHVSALARAYAAVRATPLATRLLVRGLHRRHPGTRAGTGEQAFLSALARQDPTIGEAVERVARVFDDKEAATASELSAALVRIEQALKT